MRWLRSFLDNDSLFGQVMARCGVLIAANLLFLLFSLPVVTIGAAWTALYFTMMKTLRDGPRRGGGNPFRLFWQGFRENFKQATAAFLLLALLAAVLGLELFWCGQFTGPVSAFRYGLAALLLVEAVAAAYLFPTMAAFRGSLRDLLRDSIYFAVRRPVTLLLVLFLHTVPMAVTYLDAVRLPLYAFLWCTFGFSGTAMCCGGMLLKQFSPLLAPMEDGEAAPEDGAQTLEDMRKLGM